MIVWYIRQSSVAASKNVETDSAGMTANQAEPLSKHMGYQDSLGRNWRDP